MTDQEKHKLKVMADALISTLGSMPAKKADGIVGGVADVIYKDFLGKKGDILKTQDVQACAGKETQHVIEYKWIEWGGE